ncbi:Rz-like lysis system protein LysB [Burkholderia glumae]|uniref:protein lysB n=1 Tax=Burkholderia glumae TaxID=337 RepID=UPI00203671D0|nr:protein lysB [Burkholderia glumae]MCM2495723.1 protein lysB [Burkholderia glumae]
MSALSPLLIKLLAGAALVAVVGCGVMYVRAVRAERDELAGKLDTAKHDIATRDATISGLASGAVEKGRQQQQLDTATAHVEAASSKIRQQIREAVYENASARAWADTPLPDDVMRVSASPAYTSAANFGARVPAPVAVRAASAGAAN